MSRFSCHIIGETGVTISCAELLLQRRHKILSIVSNDKKVKKWAEENYIHYHASIDTIGWENDFDYLFSIANPEIIPQWLIDKPKKFAINYHDSILPKYAGTNAPSWAILNGELLHGVTWHIIDKKVDAGDILEQDNFTISDGETVLSLNLKCFQAALSSFSKLLKSIEYGEAKRSIQQLNERTFYFKHKKPSYGGIINWFEPAQKIDKLCRALNFGDKINKFCTAKIFMTNKLYVVQSHKITNIGTKFTKPGEILSVSDKSFEVATEDGTIIIEDLIDISAPGKILSQIIKEHEIRKGDQLPLLSEKELLDYQIRLETIAKQYPDGTIDEFDQFKDFVIKLNLGNNLDYTASKHLPQISLEDRSKIIQWNETDASYFDKTTVHKLFEEMVEKIPEAIAVSYEDSHITYQELNKRANGLARYLLTLKQDDYRQPIIGILMDRCVEMVISMLAVLKAGMAYLPIDTHYPYKRTKHMLEDANAVFVITKTGFTDTIFESTKPIFIDQIVYTNEDSNLNFYDIQSLIYILYTSGSTGLPKGADLMHLGVSNLLMWYKKEFNINQLDNILIFTAFGFDLTQKNILGGLISGASVNLYSQKMFDATQISRHIDIQKITFINCPPSAFYSIIDGGTAKDLQSLRIILLGGETIKTEQIRPFIEENSKCHIVNTYGPTECSDLSLTHILTDHEIKYAKTIPLGRNVGNVTIFILDNHFNMIPIGKIGEIYIGGIGLARGYWNRPDVTAQIFIANPFTNKNEFPKADKEGSRIYKTGDLGRYLPDGKVEFLGRIDHQVKIRGFRIELGEIESVIAKVNGVKQSVVIIVEEEDLERKKIVGYVVTYAKHDNVIDEIRKSCLQNLPDYMQPNQIILLDKIPLTPNGKTDRDALPKPTGREGMDRYHKPTYGPEECLANILSDLLNIKDVSSTDNFFRLGGDSIIAIKVIGLMKKHGYNIKISDLYNFKTIKDIASNLPRGQKFQNDLYQPFSLINKEKLSNLLDESVQDIYPASFLQKGMLIESLKDSRTYHDVFSYYINKEFVFDSFFKVCNFLVTKHSILRSSFVEDEENTYLVLELRNIKLKDKIIVRNYTSDISKIVSDEASISFRFSDPGLFRFIVVEKEKGFYLIISFHHALADGWSLASLVGEFVDLYIYNKETLLENTLPSYAEFIQEEIKDSNRQEYLDNWKSILQNFENKSRISCISKENLEESPYTLRFDLGDFESLQIIKYAEKRAVTVDTIFLSAFIYALSRIGNYHDIMLGLIVNNRPERLNSEKQIGLYLNTIPFRYILDNKEEFINIDYLVEDLHISKTKFLEVKKYPYLKLKQELRLPRDFYDFCFNYVHFHILSKQLEEGFLEIGPFHEKTDLPCTLDVWRKLDKFNVSLNVNAKNLSKADMGRVLSYLKYFLETLIAEKNCIPRIMPEDLANINFWNTNEKLYFAEEETIVGLIESEVEDNPDRIALVHEGRYLTYCELNKRANKLAHYLKNKHKIKPDTLVALCLDRSELMLVSILGVLKAGGAYVPLDPSYPDERIKYILEDTNTRVVLTNNVYKKRIEEQTYYNTIGNRINIGITKSLNVIAMDDPQIEKQLNTEPTNKSSAIISNATLAYVIYTSGTTGKPKGVMINHNGLLNRINWMNDRYPLNEYDKIIQKTPYVFDVSVWELLWPCCYGACVVFAAPEAHKDASYIIDLIINESITITHFVPSMLVSFISTLKVCLRNTSLQNWHHISSLRYIFCSGEELNLKELQDCHSVLPFVKVSNLYGPTEASIDVLFYDCADNSIEKIYIGRPIVNTKCYVLDKNLSLLPIGAIGELYIEGVGLARGYLNRPELTAEKFIANLFQSEEERKLGKNTRLYKTGDLVRWLPDGNLEYIGRNDFQVKIRGYRIELGEIENALSSYQGIKQSVVLAKEHTDNKGTLAGNKYLVGYYVSNSKLNEKEILSYLQSKLPEYMIPSIFVYLESLPLTINGKLDRKALPDPEFINSDSYVGPRNELEAQVCEIWAEVLALPKDKLGIQDDFFRLGGDSITSIRLVSKLRQRLGITVSVRDIFNYKNIERLCDNILNKESINIAGLKTEQGILSGELALLPIQQWFFESNYAVPNYWNQSFLVRIPNLELDKLRSNIAQLVEHHDVFRLRYKTINGVIIQYYNTDAKLEELKTLDIRTLGATEGSLEFDNKLQEIFTNWQCNFNLEQGPIYSIGYVYGYADASSRIYFALHHLIVDTVSWRILAEDLKDLSSQKELGKKGSSYRQWSEVIKEYANTHESEKDYWNSILADYLANNQLYKLMVSEDTRNYTTLQLDSKQTKQLLRESSQVYHTEINDILITALSYALYEIADNEINHITLEGHGREEIDSNIDITRTVGWFTIMYPVRLEIGVDIADSIKKTKENLRRIPNKGIGYGALIGYQSDTLPRVSFNYLGQFDSVETEVKNVWNIIAENSGIAVHEDNEDYNIININGLVIDGEFKFTIASKLDRNITNKLAEVFKDKLQDIIEHTISQDRSYLTVSDIENIISQEYLDRLQKFKEVEGVYLANSLQQGFIYHFLNQGNIDDAYIVQLVLQYNNSLEVEKLKEAWGYAQARFSSLRLRLSWEEELVQVIDRNSTLDWRYIDLTTEQDEEIQEYKIKEIQENDRRQVYNLEQGSLFRIYLIKQSEEKYRCIFSNHHAILDGWSGPILLGYVHDTYLKLCNEEAVLLSIDHSYKEAQAYIQKHQEDHQDYWSKYLLQIEEKSDLSSLLLDNNKTLRISEYKHILQPEEQVLTISDKLYDSLKSLSQEKGITLNAILQYAWHKVLSIYGNSKQTMVGVIVSGRNVPINDIENSVGLYINTLPLIVDHGVQRSKNVITSIKDIQDNISEINNKSYVNLARLQSRGQRLFDSLFIYENYPSPINKEQQSRLKISFKSIIEKLDYPLAVMAYEANNELTFSIKYAGELFRKDSIEQLLLITKTLLEQIADGRKQQSQDLKYLDQEQYKQIIQTWNQTDKDYPDNKTIHKLFEEQVERTPDSIAVVYEEEKLSYRKLNDRANQLANYLIQDYNIQPDTLIALCLDRSEHMLIAILAVLKSGGAYVPMDPGYPGERIKYILEDTNAEIVLTNEEYQEKLKGISGVGKNSITNNEKANNQINVISVDTGVFLQDLSLQSTNNPIRSGTSNNLAYVIYTSGTTGHPKGVLIEHNGVVNTILSLNNVYDLRKGNKATAFTSYVFDVSISELFTILFNGGELHLLSEKARTDTSLISEYITSNNINYIYLPPVLLASLPRINYKTLHGIIYAGEPCDIDTGKYWSNNNYSLYNYYGPTEITIYACGKQIIDGDVNLIGSPISNTNCYVLSTNLTPLPIGAIGELYIGGVGLARGYLNKPDLTAEKFIVNLFQTEEEKKQCKNARLYKTGDLVRWLHGGSLEYIGRNDFQVKVRGYRIELGEIELILSSYEGIKQSVVVLKEREETKYLVGYYVCEKDQDEEEIKKHLATKLPEYAIPTILIRINKIPVNINGKLDRSALPEVGFKDNKNINIPKTEVERKIRGFWAEILQIDSFLISIDSNFFDLGGNSIALLKLKSRLEQHFNHKDLKIIDLFKHTTIKSLAGFFMGHRDFKLLNSNNKVELGELDYSIAVIGMSGIFSGSNNIEKFWESIVEGKESLDRLSNDQCMNSNIKSDFIKDKNYIPVGGKVENIYEFDPAFWNLSINDAKLLDPQVRKFLEYCWMALENSGYIKDRESKNVGVFAGMSYSKYYEDRIKPNSIFSSSLSNWELQTMVGHDYLATRISYLLGLTGPAINVNTACSTSLVAIVEACKNLAIGACNMALAGGVCLLDASNHGYIYSEGMIFSKDGHCRVFDDNSTGTVPGMGLGVVVLKRMEEAKKDGDNIIATIKGYCTNNDGNRKIGFTAPSVLGQTECIISAQKMAQIGANTIGYVEAHGTGTALGDPIEMTALHDAFISNSKSYNYDCFIGAVKANIGHADTASGIAGFIKVCKMLKEKVIPPQINFSRPNSNLSLSPFRISKEKCYWEKKKYPRRAGISSFGIGGTNAHVILEEYESKENLFNSNKKNIQAYSILPISAKTHESYQKYCVALSNYLNNTQEVNLGDIGYSLQLKREHFNLRNFVVAKDIDEALSQINTHISYTKLDAPKLLFMFSGQGSQYHKMSRILYKNNQIFRYYFDQSCRIIDKIKNCSFKDVIFRDNEESKKLLNETSWSQLALFTVSYALAKLLEHLNIIADCYIGHSLGEYVAACLSGVFSLNDALIIIAKRAEIMQSMKVGKMLAVSIDEQELYKVLPKNLEIAVYNAPKNLVVSGEERDIDDFANLLKSQGILCKKLNTSHAFHSKMMKKATEEFKLYLKDFSFKKPEKMFVSNITGKFISDDLATSYEYWAEHIRQPVKFSDGIKFIREENMVYLEVGPGKTLTSLVKQHQNNEQEIFAINTLPSEKQMEKVDDVQEFYKSLGILWSLGIDVDWAKFNDMNDLGIMPNFVNNLPNYQFETGKYCFDYIQDNTDYLMTQQKDWTYTINWQRIKDFDNQQDNKADIKTVMIFKDAFGVLDNLVSFLRSKGENVLVVSYDKEIQELNIKGLNIYINPYKEEHYKELSNHLLKNKLDISHVIHGWTLTDIIYNDLEYEFSKFIGMYSMYFLQNYILNKYSEKIYLSVLSNGISQVTGRDIIHYNKSTLVGAVRSISYETSNLKTLILDFGFENNKNIISLSNFIFNPDNYINDPYYAKSLSQLWKEEYSQLYLERDYTKDKIENGDVILITGGLGGIGLVIAKEISKRHKVTFVMLSRSNVASNSNPDYCQFQLDNLSFIKNNNCQVEVILCDISDFSQVSTAINQAKDKFHKISGVIHAASSQPLLIQERNLASMEEAIKAKILGSINILNSIAKEELKFFALTSSLDSLTGGIGIFEYCAANSFLDVLCTINLSNLNLISINWPNWENIGMNIKYKEQNISKKPFRLSKDDGAEIFYKLINLNHGYKRVAVSKIDIAKLKASVFHKTNYSSIKSTEDLVGSYLEEDNGTDLEKAIGEIFCSILGQKRLSKYKSFFSLGGNSLTVIKLLSLLREKVGFSINMVEFYSNDNIHSLATFIEAVGLERLDTEYIKEGAI